MAQQLTEQETQQLDELSRSLSTGTEAAAVDVCGIWRKIRPYWSIIVKAVGFIPRVGPAIAAILQTLGAGLDAYCKTAREATAEGGVDVTDEEEREINQAFSEVFGYSLTGAATKGGGAEAAGEPPFCAAWRRLKPYWPTILRVIGKIPIVGSKIAAVLTALGRALDELCGTGGR